MRLTHKTQDKGTKIQFTSFGSVVFYREHYYLLLNWSMESQKCYLACLLKGGVVKVPFDTLVEVVDAEVVIGERSES